MKCSRCGNEMEKLHTITDSNGDARLYLLCENCLGKLKEFMKGKKLCKCNNKAYITTMFEDVWEK